MNIENKIFEELFKKLETGNRSDIKDAKEQIKKLWNADSESFEKAGSFIIQKLETVNHIKDGERRAATISGMNMFVLALTDDYFDDLVKFILKNIEDPDGRVREATRHIASWLRFKNSKYYDFKKGKKVSDDMKRKAEKDIKIYEEFIDKIEELMRKYTPVDKPLYIGDAPASVYKTLVLFWYDMSFGTSRDSEHREQLMDPTSTEYIPRMGNDDDEEEVDGEEVMENIWADEKDGDSREGGKWLKRLEEISAKRFKNELERLKFSHKEIGDIVATLRIYGQEAGPSILNDIIPKGKERGSILNISDANNLVREMQAFANHCVAQNQNGPISHLLVEALIERDCMYSSKPDDLVKFIKLICQSHERISDFFVLHKKETRKRFLSMLEFYKKISKSAEDEKEFALEYGEREKRRVIEQYWGESVAHHILDWYIQIDPGGFNRTNDPRKITALVLAMARDYNAKVTDVFLSYDNKELSEFGGWKGGGSFSTVDYKITRPLLERVGDPDLLLVDPTHAKVLFQ